MQLSNRLAHTPGDTKSIKILGKIKDKGRVHAAYEFGKRSLSGEGETV